MNPDNLEIVKLTISILSIVATSIFSLVTIIITCHNANKQVKESEKALKQQEQQYKKACGLRGYGRTGRCAQHDQGASDAVWRFYHAAFHAALRHDFHHVRP